MKTDGVLTIPVGLADRGATAKLQVLPSNDNPEWKITLEMPGRDPAVWSYTGRTSIGFSASLASFLNQYVTSENLRRVIRVTLEQMMQILDERTLINA